jgi:hypothetical protein
MTGAASLADVTADLSSERRWRLGRGRTRTAAHKRGPRWLCEP